MRCIETDSLTKEQQRAIKSLERALKKCSDVGIGIFGMNSSLYAVNYPMFSDALENNEIKQSCTGYGEFPNTRINDYEVYKDSGGDDPYWYQQNLKQYEDEED